MQRGLLLKNYSTGVTLSDTLHEQEPDVKNHCTEKRCLGSMILMPGYAATSRHEDELKSMAKDFFNAFFASTDLLDSPDHTKRWEEVTKEIASTGTYELTEEELYFGAKLAWRNASRCIGRIQWSNLKLFDARHVKTARQMFEAICKHIEYGTNDGNIRSAITVFPQRREGRPDFRVWNPQLVSYAGYKMDDGTTIGDPINVELTKVCQRLGWKSKRKQWDILPMVLSNGIDGPEFFDLPPEIVKEVHLSHPTYDWFEKLGLRWYCLPAVSNMLFDVGGVQFPAAPFNGWYMVTEISCRNLCDAQRLNVLELVAAEMGEDTSSHATMWKDRVMLEVNVAVLHSFQQDRVTMVDHHTASESFIKHLFNEQKARNGCPADWVWIVPPMSGSLTSVFHQEMALYSLKPSYEYQIPAWLTHDWGVKKSRGPRYSLKQIARAVQATVRLFHIVLDRRVNVTILYATETGRSEMFARQVADVFFHGFNPKVICMDEYNFDHLQHESLLIVVASTFQNGDAPRNGLAFANKLSAGVNDDETVTTEPPPASSIIDDVLQLGTIKESEGLLKNLRFSVFALGSSVYPHFCAFGHQIDSLMGKLGGQRLLAVKEADEMSGQEKSFGSWLTELYPEVCQSFNVVEDESILKSFSTSELALTAEAVRFVQVPGQLLDVALSKSYKKQVEPCGVIRKTTLNDQEESGNIVFLLEISSEQEYQPGDHVGIFPENRRELVNGILGRLKCDIHPNQPVRVQVQKESISRGAIVKTWAPFPNFPPCSLRILLSRFLDITSPLNSSQLEKLATFVLDPEEKRKMTELATNPVTYENWRNWHYPHLLEVMEQFPSLTIPPPLLVTILNPMQPRFYSISSSSDVHKFQVHLTAGVVKFKTRGGDGPEHYGVCSNYLYNTNTGDTLYMFVRRCHNFSLPTDLTTPVIMIGPGTGVAPFRGFWQQRMFDLRPRKGKNKDGAKGMWLFFGCRSQNLDIFRDEKNEAVRSGALEKNFLALSREPNVPKTYVQDLLKQEGLAIYQKLTEEDGHMYVCGDVSMADQVSKTLVSIAQTHGQMDEKEAQRFLKKIKVENRYHEDVFGVVHVTPAMQKISMDRRNVDAGPHSHSRRGNFLRRFFC